MKAPLAPLLAFGASAALIVAAVLSIPAGAATEAPQPNAIAPETGASSETVVLAGGSFWGMQAVYQHVDGVERAVSGYAGGHVANPTFEQVNDGKTGHAQAVAVTFDTRKVGLGDILRIYFSVAHDPTQVDRQGADVGSQYRSEIFVSTTAEAKFAAAYIAQIDAAHVFAQPIATKVETLKAFYPAENYHQNYVTLNVGEPYVMYNDLPRLENLKRLFPAQYHEAPTLAATL